MFSSEVNALYAAVCEQDNAELTSGVRESSGSPPALDERTGLLRVATEDPRMTIYLHYASFIFMKNIYNQKL